MYQARNEVETRTKQQPSTRQSRKLAAIRQCVFDTTLTQTNNETAPTTREMIFYMSKRSLCNDNTNTSRNKGKQTRRYSEILEIVNLEVQTETRKLKKQEKRETL